jgi:hypothetical protein
MAKKFSGLSRGGTRSGKSGLGQQPTGTLGRKPKQPKTLAAGIAKAEAKRKAAEAQAKRPLMPTGFMAASIKRRIEKLRRKEEWSFRERHKKTDFYAYLDDVYRVQDWHNEKDSKRWARNVAALYEIDLRKNKSPIHIIIDASSEEEDRRVKSRWAIAAAYAVAMRVPKSEFIEFLDNNGGVQGCANKMAALEKERAKLKSKRERW